MKAASAPVHFEFEVVEQIHSNLAAVRTRLVVVVAVRGSAVGAAVDADDFVSVVEHLADVAVVVVGD